MELTAFVITERGDLRIDLTSAGRHYLHEHYRNPEQWTDTEIFLELIDEHLTAGWYVIPSAQVRTSSHSVLLSHDVQFDDDGAITSVGIIYWCPRQEMEPYISTLLKRGYLIFEKGN